MRKDSLATGEVYHIFNKSIAGYVIFNNRNEYRRMLEIIQYYQASRLPMSFSNFIAYRAFKKNNKNELEFILDQEKIVQIIAFCIMPTHIHLILKQLADKGVSTFLSNIQNSYTRYFNIKHKRKGPLWEGRFKNVLVEDDEQLLHLTRYVHLNPVTANLVRKPEEWMLSSYGEYLDTTQSKKAVCRFQDFFEIRPKDYRKFVNNRVSYQKQLAEIKHLVLV